MSDTTTPAGAAGVTGAPALPTDPAAAAAQLDSLKSDESFMKRVGAADPEAFSQYNRLWRISRGMTPEPVAPVNEADVHNQTSYRATLEAEGHRASLIGAGLSDEEAYQVQNLRPIPLAEKQWHQRQLEALKKDSAWVARYMANDVEAIAQMRRHSVGMTMPVGTLEQINRWNAAHGRPKVG